MIERTFEGSGQACGGEEKHVCVRGRGGPRQDGRWWGWGELCGQCGDHQQFPPASLVWTSLSLPFPKAEAAGRSPCPPLLVLNCTRGPKPTLEPSFSVGHHCLLFGHRLATCSLPSFGASVLIYLNNKNSMTIFAGLSPFLKVGSCLSSHWVLIKNMIVQYPPIWGMGTLNLQEERAVSQQWHY